jgi:hypothetical protein
MKIRKINEIDPDIKIKNYFDFIYGLSTKKQTEYVEFLKSLNLTDEQYIKLADIIRDQFDDGRILGPIGEDY